MIVKLFLLPKSTKHVAVLKFEPAVGYKGCMSIVVERIIATVTVVTTVIK